MARSRNFQKSRECRRDVRDVSKLQRLKAPPVEFDPDGLVPENEGDRRDDYRFGPAIHICFSSGLVVAVERMVDLGTAHVSFVS